MSKRRWMAAAMVGLAGLMLCSGCGVFRGKKGAGEDVVSPDIQPLPGDVGLGSRAGFEAGEGTRITDPEAQIENVLFAFDSYQIESAEIPKIEKAAAFLRKYPEVRLITEGHCDERGSNEYNMSLGEHRADAVRAYLVGLGIDGARIQTKSFGEENPLDPGHNEAAWRVNRRVEFAFYR